MAKETNKVSFEKIMADLKASKYYPVYFLMGEEPYFIDKISEYIENNILSDDEKDMNLRVLYGKDVKMEDIILEARQYPFMAEKRVVIVKEAQNLKRNIDKLELYLKAPVESTILVFCYKYDKLDARKKYVKEIETIGVLFQSNHLYDSKLPEWIMTYCHQTNLKIEPNAASMLASHIGNNLMRIASEVDKIRIITHKDNVITTDIVEKNIGISKDYNNFELVNALGQKNYRLVFQIIDYFGKSPKNFVIQVTLSVIFNFFLNLLNYQLLKDKSSESVSQRLGINRFFVKDYVVAAQMYSLSKIRKIIGYIRQIDAKSKGFGNVNTPPEDLLKELCFYILN